MRLKPQFDINNLFNLREKPRIDPGELLYFFQAKTLRKSIAHVPDALRARLTEFFFEYLAVFGFFIHAVDADFQSAQGFLKRLLEGTTNRHHLTHRFHLRGEMTIRLRKLLEGEARHFGDDIINRWLE